MTVAGYFITFAFDTSVLELTLIKTVSVVLEGRKLGIKHLFMYMIMRDGAQRFRFIACLPLNIVLQAS